MNLEDKTYSYEGSISWEGTFGVSLLCIEFKPKTLQHFQIILENTRRPSFATPPPLKLSAAPGGGRSLTVTRLCHLKCFCQLKRPRQLKCVCPSVRTCDRSWSFHTLSVSGKTFLDKFIPLKQLTPATQCCKIYIGRSMLRPFQGTAEDIDRGHGWGSFRQQSQPKASHLVSGDVVISV